MLVGVDPGFVDLRDPGVREASEQVGLVAEPPERGGGGHARAHELDRDGPPGRGLRRAVYRAHPTTPEQCFDAISGDSRTGG